MRLKHLVVGVAGLVSLVVVGAVIFVSTLDVDRYRADIADEAQALTGRKLTIGGHLKLTLFAAAPALVAETVSLANAPSGTEPDMLRVKRLEIQVRLMPLLSGRIEIVRLVLIEPELLLETDRNGRPNWRFEPAGGAAQPQISPTTTAEGTSGLPSIENVRIEHAHIVYRDGATGSVGDLRLETVTLKTTSMNSPIALAIKGKLDERPVDISGSFGPITDLMAGRPYPAKFEGHFGKSDIAGTIDADLGQAPVRIKGGLMSKTLDVDDLGGSSKGSAGGKLFDQSPLALDALKTLAGEVTYDIGHLAGVVDPGFDDVKIKATIKDGVLTLSPVTATLAGGTVDATLTVDARGAKPRVTAKAALKGAALGTLTKAAVGSALVTAPADAELDANGTGASVASIMASLSGHVTATAGSGAVHNDFYSVLSASPLAAINPLQAGEGPPRLNCMVARFDFTGGRGQSRVLLVDSSRSTVLGRGVVSLGEEYVDVLLVPSTKQTSAASVASLVPFRLRGPLAAPSLVPDPGEAARETAKSIIGLAEMPLNIMGSVLGVGRIVGRGAGDTCAAAIARAGGAAPAATSQPSPPARRGGADGLLERLNPFSR